MTIGIRQPLVQVLAEPRTTQRSPEAAQQTGWLNELGEKALVAAVFVAASLVGRQPGCGTGSVTGPAIRMIYGAMEAGQVCGREITIGSRDL